MWLISKKTKQGFSLPEVVVYVALVTVLFVAVTANLLSISQTAREVVAWQSLQTEGQAVMDRLVREIRAATSTDLSSTFNSSPGRLVLVSGGLNGGASGNTVIAVDGSNNLALKVGSGATSTLTNKTEVESLIFRQLTNDEVSGIKIELTLQTKSGLPERSLNFYDSVILRSSYGN